MTASVTDRREGREAARAISLSSAAGRTGERRSTVRLAAAFASGLVFALGLGIAGMTRPAKVIGFLDLTGHWDPSLAFVMVGAIGVHAAYLYRLGRRLPSGAPPARGADRALVVGAAIFGIGWGIAGFCPGPAVVSLVTGWRSTLAFVAAMIAGTAAQAFVAGRAGTARADECLRS